MDDILVKYLVLKKKCPLPGLGILQVIGGISSFKEAEKKIFPPVPFIQYTPAETPANDLEDFIANDKNISLEEAKNKLEAYCNSIKKLKGDEEFDLPNAGKFYLNVNGNLLFNSTKLPAEFLPVTQAEPIVHVETPSLIPAKAIESPSEDIRLVTAAPTIKPKKQRWWIAAAILTLISLVAILFYLNDKKHGSYFGNSQKVKVGVEGKTYQKIP